MSFVIVFRVDGDPRGKGRPRFRKIGNIVSPYTDSKTRAYESAIQIAAKNAMGSGIPLEGPVSVDLYIRCSVPVSYPKKRQKACYENTEMPTKKPDIDNTIKAYLDAMNGIIYKDDIQVVKVTAKKAYSIVPGVDVCVVQI